MPGLEKEQVAPFPANPFAWHPGSEEVAPDSTVRLLKSHGLGMQVSDSSLQVPPKHAEDSHVCPGRVKLQCLPLDTVLPGMQPEQQDFHVLWEWQWPPLVPQNPNSLRHIGLPWKKLLVQAGFVQLESQP